MRPARTGWSESSLSAGRHFGSLTTHRLPCEDSSTYSNPSLRCARVRWKLCAITKTFLYNFDPLKPHFYIVKLGFTGVYIFLYLLKNIDCGYSLEPPRRGGSNEYPQSMFWAEIWKVAGFFLSDFFQFLEAKFSIYLNRRVFVMLRIKLSAFLRLVLWN